MDSGYPRLQVRFNLYSNRYVPLMGDNYSSLSCCLNKKCYRISQMSSIAYFRTSWFFVFPLAHWC